MRIIDKKTNYRPIQKIGLCIKICFDYEPIIQNEKETEFASWNMHIFASKPSFIELRSLIIDEINKITDKTILDGFKWKDMAIWLSAENQFNYKAAYDLAFQTNGANLPVIFKFGSIEEPIYYKFNTLEELQDFYIESMSYINKQLEIGWNKKDSIDWSVYEKALDLMM